MIYLDWNATAPILSSVQYEMSRASWGNPNALYQIGLDAEEEICKAERKVRSYLGASGGDLLWTQSGSMANHLFLNHVRVDKERPRKYISPFEHKSLYGYPKRHTIPNDKRNLLYDKIVDPDVISLMHINNETGELFPVKRLREMVKGNYILHVDAVQSLGKISLDVDKSKIDAVTLSAHKVGGPKGVGCLWIRDKQLLSDFPYLGTPNTPGIVGFSKALDETSPDGKTWEALLVREKAFLSSLGVDFTLHVPSEKPRTQPWAPHKKIPGVLSICFPGIDIIDLYFKLADTVAFSTGAACSRDKTSRVLTNMGVPEDQIRSTIRISMGYKQSIREIKEGAELITMAIKEIRNGS